MGFAGLSVHIDGRVAISLGWPNRCIEMVERESSPAHFARPLPEEPWRYSCPDCGTTAVDRLEKRGDRSGHHEFPFYCTGCEEKLAHVIDNKTGKRVYNVRRATETK